MTFCDKKINFFYKNLADGIEYLIGFDVVLSCFLENKSLIF